jgi:Mlc titration factor MtfA (ptsG expression regulator)
LGLRLGRRRRDEAAGFPEPWRRIIALRLAAWRRLDLSERARLEDLVLGLLGGKRWTAANGFELDDEVMVTVAAHAALLVLGDGLGLDCYRNVTSIEVHASTIEIRGPQHTGLPGGLMFDGTTSLLGRAEFRGPVSLAWDAVLRDVRHPQRGHNVVFHEFAHALDMLDGAVDGTPPLTRPDIARWVEVCLAEYTALRRGHQPDPDRPAVEIAADGGPIVHGEILAPYAATSPGEFFAVATETFFTRPVALRGHKPALYGVLAGFYRQDPAARRPETSA